MTQLLKQLLMQSVTQLVKQLDGLTTNRAWLRTSLLSAALTQVMLLSGCVLPFDGYSTPAQRTPVEVRRGENYGGSVYQTPRRESRNGAQTNAQDGSQNSAQYDRAPTRQDSDAQSDRTAAAQGLPAPRREPEVYTSQEGKPTAPAKPKYSKIPAVARLIDKAYAEMEAEEYQQAVAHAESALRLDPNSTAAYEALAQVYLREERYQESEQMALRAMSLLKRQGNDSEQAPRLWQLIAESRRNQGDADGAERAMERAGGRY